MRTDRTSGSAGGPRVHLVAIDEQTAWLDPALASFFQQLRAACGLTQSALALHLATTVDVIEHLEAGRVRALPMWPETERIVTSYGRLAGLDLGPAARRIRQLTVASDPLLDAPLSAAPGRPVTADARHGAGVHAAAGRLTDRMPQQHAARLHLPAFPGGSRTGRRRAWMLGGGIACALLVAAGLVASPAVPGTVRETLAVRMPEALARHMRASHDLDMTWRRGQDGMLWLETSDPRSRKADKLPSAPAR